MVFFVLFVPFMVETHLPSWESLDVEGGEEVLERLLLGELDALEALDLLLEGLDLRLLGVELLQVTLVRRRRRRHLLQVRTQTRLVLRDHLQLPLLLLDVALRLRRLP